jgi:hypothetical protein
MNSTKLTVRNKTANKLLARDMNRIPSPLSCAHWSPEGEGVNQASDPAAFLSKKSNNNKRTVTCIKMTYKTWFGLDF